MTYRQYAVQRLGVSPAGEFRDLDACRSPAHVSPDETTMHMYSRSCSGPGGGLSGRDAASPACSWIRVPRMFVLDAPSSYLGIGCRSRCERCQKPPRVPPASVAIALHRTCHAPSVHRRRWSVVSVEVARLNISELRTTYRQ